MNGKKGLTGSALKWIAVITMLIDHIGATVLWDTYENHPGPQLYMIYKIFRDIGRIAFPLYCFLLVEGFCHTKNWKKYAGRLFAFALISEVPFSLAISGSWLSIEMTNVLFTMLIGVLVLQGIRQAEKSKKKILVFFIMAAGCLVAELGNVDYGCAGVLVILAFYLLRETPVWAGMTACLILSIMTITELPAFFSVIPICVYNKERGRQSKYFFYWFYPVHLLLLGLIVRYL